MTSLSPAARLLLDHPPDRCRYLLGDPDIACGWCYVKALDGSAWCPEHHAVVYGGKDRLSDTAADKRSDGRRQLVLVRDRLKGGRRFVRVVRPASRASDGLGPKPAPASQDEIDARSTRPAAGWLRLPNDRGGRRRSNLYGSAPATGGCRFLTTSAIFWIRRRLRCLVKVPLRYKSSP
jgi:hypothetical protein